MKENKIKNLDLSGISQPYYYENGNLQECILTEYNEIKTPYGTFVPQFDRSEERRKHINSLSFYMSGNLKSLSLQKQTLIKTSIGELPAEFLTFYEGGALKRLFLLNGKISGFWTEENEFTLANKYNFETLAGNFQVRPIGIYFYESGAIKSITFWPGEKVEFLSPIGPIVARTGISFYSNGNIKSLEPESLVKIKTPIGEITSFHTSPLGLNADNNSLCFYEEGTIKSLITSTDIVTITDKNKKKYVFRPVLRPSLLEENKQEINPLKISFEKFGVRFNDSLEIFDIHTWNFSIKYFPKFLSNGCSDCSSCSMCG